MEKKESHIATLAEVFTYVDADGNGHITLDEFVSALEHQELLAFLSGLGIDADDAEALFMLLLQPQGKGADAQRAVDVETFVVGCIKLRGDAKAMDVMSIHQPLAKMQTSIKKVELQVRKLRQRIDMPDVLAQI